jgi:hypothetical protein
VPKELGSESPLHTGWFYFCGRDYLNHPVFVINLKKAWTQEKIQDNPRSIDFIFFQFQHAVDNMMVPSQIESFSQIFDLDGIQPW